MNKASTETKSFTGKLDKIIATAAKAFVGLATAVGTAAFAIGKSAVSAASDFSEEVSKSKVIFGEASKEVEDYLAPYMEAIKFEADADTIEVDVKDDNEEVIEDEILGDE